MVLVQSVTLCAINLGFVSCVGVESMTIMFCVGRVRAILARPTSGRDGGTPLEFFPGRWRARRLGYAVAQRDSGGLGSPVFWVSLFSDLSNWPQQGKGLRKVFPFIPVHRLLHLAVAPEWVHTQTVAYRS